LFYSPPPPLPAPQRAAKLEEMEAALKAKEEEAKKLDAQHGSDLHKRVLAGWLLFTAAWGRVCWHFGTHLGHSILTCPLNRMHPSRLDTLNESLRKAHEKLASAEDEHGQLSKTISVSGRQGS